MNDTERTARTKLDDLVVNTELTLISIIQGVALYFLTDTVRQALGTGDMSLVPYFISGLFIILLFWSRSIIHTFTVIRWPLEFGHNFLYIACTFAEALLFTMIPDVQKWYVAASAYTFMIWGLFIFDLRMIHKRQAERASGRYEKLFLNILHREQQLIVRRAMPASAVFFTGAAVAVSLWPGYFVAGKGHLWFGIPQLLAAGANLVYVLVFYRRIAPLILRMRRTQ